MDIDIVHTAIQNLYNNSGNVRDGKLYLYSHDTLDFVESDGVEAVQAEMVRLQSVIDSLEYSRSRKSAYDLLNQDEMRYDDLVNGTTTWPDAIAAIKQEFPK